MNVYLTGQNGFVGSYVHKELLDRGFGVITTDTDLTKEVPDIKAEYIVNVASRADVPESLESPEDFIGDNVELLLNVLSLARRIMPSRVIHLSSAEVYGTGTHGINDPHRPNNPYAASKAAQDSICRAYRESFGVPVSIAVTQNVWGEGQPSNKFYPQIKSKVLTGDQLSVVDGVRRFTHASYLARRIADLLHEPVGDYHIAGDKMTNLEFATTIASDEDRELNCQIVESDRPGHESVFVLEDLYG